MYVPNSCEVGAPNTIAEHETVPVPVLALRGGMQFGDFGVDAILKQPKVPYLETIKKKVGLTEGKHKKQSGGSGQYGKIDYTIEPGELNSGYEFESKVTGGNVPREYWGAIEKAFNVSMEEGTLAGFPLVSVAFDRKDREGRIAPSTR